MLAEPKSRPALRWPDLAAGALLAAYFLFFASGTLSVHFALDDPMNMGKYWEMGTRQLVLAQFMPWHGYYRPMGGLFYMPLLEAYGLEPAPYHLVINVILLAATWMVYWFARRLGCDRITAGVAGAALAYHGGLSNLYYNSAFVFDVLCGFFYLAAFLYYARVRDHGRPASVWQLAAFLALYLCALNSKEMAVTLPLMLLVYEWFFRGRGGLVDLWPWVRGNGRLWTAASLLCAASVYGVLFSPNALASESGYGVVFSLERLVKFEHGYLGDVLFRWERTDTRFLLGVWTLVTVLAWWRKRPVLRFCWFWMLLTPLPIMFLEGRAGACLYIPAIGWAVFAAVTVQDIAELIGHLLPQAMWRQVARGVVTAAAVLLLAMVNYQHKQRHVQWAMDHIADSTWDVIQQLRAMNPQVRPHSKVVFLDSPFEGWDMLFLAELWFRDRSLEVRLQPKNPLPLDDLAKAEHIFTFSHGKLVRVR